MPSRHDVLNEIRSQWLAAVAERRNPTTRYGYVKREESFELFVYGRGGEFCKTCGSTLREIRLGQRASVYCVRCQR